MTRLVLCARPQETDQIMVTATATPKPQCKPASHKPATKPAVVAPAPDTPANAALLARREATATPPSSPPPGRRRTASPTPRSRSCPTSLLGRARRRGACHFRCRTRRCHRGRGPQGLSLLLAENILESRHRCTNRRSGSGDGQRPRPRTPRVASVQPVKRPAARHTDSVARTSQTMRCQPPNDGGSAAMVPMPPTRLPSARR